MNRLQLALLGGTAVAVPLTSLAGPTVYIPLGAANEILIVDAATDKVIGKIDGVNNAHGLSITPNGEYLIAGSNAEHMAGRPNVAGHGKKPGMCDPSSMSKPAGMSKGENQQMHAQKQSGGMMGSPSTMMGGSSPMTGTGKPEAPGYAGAGQPGPSKMAKPAGMSQGEHQQHHAQPQSGGMMGSPSTMMGGPSQMAGKPDAPGYAGAGKPDAPGYAGAGKPGHAKMAKPAGMSEAQHKKHHAPQAGGLPIAAGISHVSLIRVADRTLAGRIKVRGMAHHNLVTPDGRYAVSTHTTAGTISLIDLATKKIFRTILTGPLPNYVAVTRDGKRMYVSNAGNNTLSVIDTKNWIVSRNIVVGKGPEHIVISPDEEFIYTGNRRDGSISAVSIDQNKVVKTYAVGNTPHGIDISSDGKTLFASAKKDNKLVAIDVETGKVRTLELKPAPYQIGRAHV